MLAGNGFTPCQIPGGMYRGNPKPKDSMGLFGRPAHHDQDERRRRLLDSQNRERRAKSILSGVHKIYKRWDPKKAGHASSAMPLHEGAKRFYKEIGGIDVTIPGKRRERERYKGKNPSWTGSSWR